MMVIDIVTTNEIPGEYIGYVCEPSPQSAVARHKAETGQITRTVYRRVHGELKFTTFYILNRKGGDK